MQISQLGGNPIVMGGEALLDTYYPVGRIYLSSENVSPASFMGGSWERIEDVFLLCAGTTYAAGSTGGEAEVSLVSANNGGHTHDLFVYVNGSGAVFNKSFETSVYNTSYLKYDAGAGIVWTPGTTQNNVLLTNLAGSAYPSGSGEPFSILPPYRAIYAWERVA